MITARQVYSPKSLAVKLEKSIGRLASNCPLLSSNAIPSPLAMTALWGLSQAMLALASLRVVLTTHSAVSGSPTVIITGLNLTKLIAGISTAHRGCDSRDTVFVNYVQLILRKSEHGAQSRARPAPGKLKAPPCRFKQHSDTVPTTLSSLPLEPHDVRHSTSFS